MKAQEQFLRFIKEAATAFERCVKKEVLLFHHNDADGLSSGAILAQAFERKGLRVRRFCLEKPYPEVLATIIGDVEDDSGSVLVFADFASGMLKKLHELNRAQLPLFVLDHHAIEAVSDPALTLVNCTALGIPSDPNCSASSIALLFAVALDAANKDLSALGVLGAIGDRLLDPSGELVGINSVVGDLAQQDGSIRFIDGAYQLKRPTWLAASTLAAEVNSLGGYGYFRGGPDIAVKGLRDGCNAAFFSAAHSFQAEIQTALERFTANNFLHQGTTIQWFSLGPAFTSFGVKTVGLVCEELIARGLVDESKYLAGFQNVPNEIPGLGTLALNQTKISMRLPKLLQQAVRANRMPSLAVILPEATRAVGGFVDACHPHAAATTVSTGSEERLIAELERAVLRNR